MLRTACYDWHVNHQGHMVDFAGWEMPVRYGTITDEHHAVRKAAGLFDIAHMGRLKFSGNQACELLDHLVTNDVKKLKVGQIRYALVTNEEGGILDDVLVYRFPDFYLLVVNASNREKIVSWIDQHKSGFDASVEDLTTGQFMLALQGPKSVEILSASTDVDLAGMKYYTGVEGTVCGHSALVSRTGYTGEDGFEVIVAAAHATEVWEAIHQSGQEHGLLPAGLGCRDTLRLEAAMPLYGHELDESIDPFTAGLDFAVKLNAGPFLGREALISARNREDRRQRIGLVLQGRRIAREGCPLWAEDRQVGEVTSGTFSPTLQKTIAMGYVEAEHASPGSSLEVEIRNSRVPATVTKLPFYRRPEAD